MDTRKLQLIGGGTTYAISLPKTWVEACGFRAGDEMTLEPRPDGSLVLVAPRRVSLKEPERTLDVDGQSPDEILRGIIGLYLNGFSTVCLRYGPRSAQAAQRGVAEACTRLHGLQVVDDAPGRITLQDLAEPRDFNMEKGLRRMHLLAHQMLSLASRQPLDAEALADIQRHEAELDRLHTLLLKQHNVLLRRGDLGPGAAIPASDALAHMFVAQFLERVGDYARRIALQLTGTSPLSPALHGRVAQRLEEARGLLDDAYKAFLHRDVRLANAVIVRTSRTAKHLDASPLIDIAPPGAAPATVTTERCGGCIATFIVLEDANRVLLYAKSISEVAINRALAHEQTAVLPATPQSAK